METVAAVLIVVCITAGIQAVCLINLAHRVRELESCR